MGLVTLQSLKLLLDGTKLICLYNNFLPKQVAYLESLIDFFSDLFIKTGGSMASLAYFLPFKEY